MLSHKVLTRQDVGRAASYYEDAADDYYAKEGEASAWQGRGAAALGLAGAVESQRFRELLAGRVTDGPTSRAATRQDSNSRIGIDLTFSAPKSVSLQALIGGDAAIVRAHDLAVERAIATAEERAQARRKVRGKSQVEQTRNLVVAKFRHETSRQADPQLHTHALVLNLTQRGDGAWRALRNDQIIKSTKYLGAVYRAELAAEIQRLGYTLRHERDGFFELAHISRSQLQRFSARSAQIEGRLAEKGLTRATATAAEKQRATLATRERKSSTDRAVLYTEWRARAAALEIDLASSRRASPIDDVAAPSAERSGNGLPHEVEHVRAEAAKAAVRYAVNHLTERQAIIDRSTLLDVALKQAMGGAQLTDVERQVARQVERGSLLEESPLYRSAGGASDPPKTRDAWVAECVRADLTPPAAGRRVDEAIARGALLPQEPRYTTQRALEREQRILRVERDGRACIAAALSQADIRQRLASARLTSGQRAAVELITTTTNRVVGVQGYAGTGKSHMLRTAKAQLEAAGHKVHAIAPYASQVRALRELGVTANTVMSLLAARKQKIDARTVVVIDEAGVVPARLMDRALRLIEEAGARAVLLGDTAQTKAIEAGRPFDQLQAHGMATVRMDEIRRQQNPRLKRAVELAAEGHAAHSLGFVSRVTEVRDHLERRTAIADAYAQLSPVERERTIVVSGTNEARREINTLVRERVGTAGKGTIFETLARRDTTQAERLYAKNYAIGDVIQPERDYARSGLARGELYEVLEHAPGNRLTVRTQDGATITFSPFLHRKLSVYEPERTELAPGDRVRITRNDAALDLANGDRATVRAVSVDQVTLTVDKREIVLSAEKPLHLDLAYATTVHSSQGTTADRVLIDACSKSRTTAKDVYYVAISRARHEAAIWTDNASALPRAISRENVKHAALDLVHEGASAHVAELASAGHSGLER